MKFYNSCPYMMDDIFLYMQIEKNKIIFIIFLTEVDIFGSLLLYIPLPWHLYCVNII